MNKNERTESKANGFYFEDYIIEEYSLIPSGGYTHKWDAFTSNGDPVSIKTAGSKNEIIFGDIFRQAFIEEPLFYIIIGIWETVPEIIDDVHVIKMETERWNKLVSMDMDIVVDVKRLMVAANKGYFSGDNIYKWHALRDKANKKWAKTTPNLLRLRLKYSKEVEDGVSKDIFRPQCAIRTQHFIKDIINNDSIKSRRLEPVILETKSTKSTKITERNIVEDTEYGKRVTEETITEAKETYQNVTLFDLAD